MTETTTKPLTLSARSTDSRIQWMCSQVRCILDGVDVTKQAHTASTEGWADCYEYDADGHVIVVGGYLAEVRRYGDVRFVFTAEGEAKMKEWGWA